VSFLIVFFRVFDFLAAIASVPIANNTANTARKENKFFNVFFIFIPLFIVNNNKLKKINISKSLKCVLISFIKVV
jgi:hypothetical protein